MQSVSARSIMIDFDIHKLIETDRQSFDETDNDVLRRRLGLPSKSSTGGNGSPPPVSDTGGPWHGEGIVLPHGTELFMTYARGTQTIKGWIENGEWVVDGRRFNSPSGAASGSARKPDGTHPVLGGFKYWSIRLPSSKEWVTLAAYRKQHSAKA